MKFFIWAAVSILAVLSVQAFAEGDASAGQAKSAICGACHGSDGNSVVPNWPKLAGQHADYLVRQASLIKSGARSVPEMVGIVASMSDQDSEDIAAWFLHKRTMGVWPTRQKLHWDNGLTKQVTWNQAFRPA